MPGRYVILDAMRNLVLILLAVVASAAAWRYSGSVIHVLTHQEPPLAPIVWDNGSVRDLEPTASEPAQTITAHGVPRKCVRRDEVIYSDTACPRGFKEQGIKGGDRVTVLASGQQAQGTKAQAAKKTGSLREVLDVDDGGAMKRAITDRAIEQGAR